MADAKIKYVIVHAENGAGANELENLIAGDKYGIMQAIPTRDAVHYIMVEILKKSKLVPDPIPGVDPAKPPHRMFGGKH